MPRRIEPFATDSYYHVFNKTIDGKSVFRSGSYSRYFLNLIKYYRSSKANISYSKLKKLILKIRNNILLQTTHKKYFNVDIVSFCLMPTHFHMLVKQKIDNGVRKFMSDSLNAFTKYFNILNDRKGPLFLPQFKSVRIRSDEQLIHVSRYIHLNPYSSKLIQNIKDLITYRYSSFSQYISPKTTGICDTKEILGYFADNPGEYKKFIEGNADYQLSLEYLKHLEKWDKKLRYFHA